MDETPSPAAPCRVVVIDDHDLVRDAVTVAITRSAALELAGEASDGAGALALIERERPDVAVVDFALPDMTGLELIERSRALSPKTRHLILTGSPMDEAERRRLAERAEGFMHKEAGRDELLAAIEAAALSSRLAGAQDEDDGGGLLNAGALTKRERAVLREIARGHPVDAIADGLGISVSTVRKHRENIMQKLALNSTAQLVRAAMQIGQF